MNPTQNATMTARAVGFSRALCSRTLCSRALCSGCSCDGSTGRDGGQFTALNRDAVCLFTGGAPEWPEREPIYIWKEGGGEEEKEDSDGGDDGEAEVAGDGSGAAGCGAGTGGAPATVPSFIESDFGSRVDYAAWAAAQSS